MSRRVDGVWTPDVIPEGARKMWVAWTPELKLYDVSVGGIMVPPHPKAKLYYVIPWPAYKVHRVKHCHSASYREPLETEQDKANESQVLAAIKGRGVFQFDDCDKLDNKDYLEYCLYKNRILIAVIEIKCRKHCYGDWPSLFVSAHKWYHGEQASARLNVPFYLIARWEDGSIRYVNAADHPSPHCDYSGRTNQTRSDGDIEWMVHIPIRAFKPIQLCQPSKDDVLASIGLDTLR